MKKILFFLALIIGLSANAQYFPNRSAKDTIVVNNDTVIVNIDAIVIQPVIVNAKGDSAFSLIWQVQSVSRDTTKGCDAYIQLYDRYAQQVAAFSQYIPASIVAIWGTDNSVIDDYIFKMNPRFKRVVPKPTN